MDPVPGPAHRGPADPHRRAALLHRRWAFRPAGGVGHAGPDRARARRTARRAVHRHRLGRSRAPPPRLALGRRADLAPGRSRRRLGRRRLVVDLGRRTRSPRPRPVLAVAVVDRHHPLPCLHRLAGQGVRQRLHGAGLGRVRQPGRDPYRRPAGRLPARQRTPGDRAQHGDLTDRPDDRPDHRRGADAAVRRRVRRQRRSVDGAAVAVAPGAGGAAGRRGRRNTVAAGRRINVVGRLRAGRWSTRAGLGDRAGLRRHRAVHLVQRRSHR